MGSMSIVREMPRLSVDIDLTYLPVESRDVTLKSIGLALGRIKQEIERVLGGLCCASS